MSVIKLDKIRKSYFPGDMEFQVLKGLDIDIKEGEMVAIMGPSGSGKTTLMNILGLLDRPTDGRYYLSTREISTLDDDELASVRGRMIGFVFQSFYLLSKLNALQNVMLPLRYQSTPLNEAKERALKMLDRVGMGEHTTHKPTELSGGQQQRVAIARALVTKPSVILADEPTGALDTKTGKEIMDLFLELNRDEGKTVVIITHDPRIGAQCKRIIHIEDGEILKIEYNK